MYRRQVSAIREDEEGRIAITGCGRSGTKYTSELFKALGYRVGHESLEQHGISSWCLAPDTRRRRWGPSPKDLARLHLPYAHQVRHPVAVIASMSTFTDESWNFIAKFVPIEQSDSVTRMSMKYWYYWNQLAERRSHFTYRVEDIAAALPRLLHLGGFDESRYDPAVVSRLPTDINLRDHEENSWEMLREEDQHLSGQIQLLAEKYGYTLS